MYKANGFQLSSLAKLGDTKTFDNKGNILTFLEDYFYLNDPEVLNLVNELPSVAEATKIDLSDLDKQVATITREFEEHKKANDSTKAILKSRIS